MDRGEIKDASRALIERTRRSSARGISLGSKRLGQARARLGEYRQEIEKRTAPASAAAGRLGRRLAKAASPLTEPLRALLGAIAPFVSWIPVGIGALVALVLGTIASVLERSQHLISHRLMPALTTAVSALSSRLTPTVVASACALVAAGLLIGSQFLDYRGVAVGAPLYEGEIAVDAPAPITATAVTGSAHFWVMIPIALVAALAAVVAARRSSRLLAVAVIALGAIALTIALAVDLPKGLDPVNALPYSDAETRLLGGFWAEFFSALALIVAGAVLARGDSLRRRPKRVSRPSTGSDLAAAGGV